jgi:hypothetical protein
LPAACSQPEATQPLTCAAGEELFEGRCGDPATRYEPDERIDHDNVVAYGDPLTQLDPRSRRGADFASSPRPG